jgi:hypothetical protein
MFRQIINTTQITFNNTTRRREKGNFGIDDHLKKKKRKKVRKIKNIKSYCNNFIMVSERYRNG